MNRAVVLATLAVTTGILLPAEPSFATPPESSGTQTDTYSVTVDCGDFVATVDGTSTFRQLDFYDADGHWTRRMQWIRAPRDVWTNTSTGRTIIVRGEFQQTYTPDPGSGRIEVAIRGFRYLVNEQGKGVTVQEVGRIVYLGLDEVEVLTAAGKHELADPTTVEPQLCDALRA